MRLYDTDQGTAREDEPGVLTIVDQRSLGDLVRDGGIDSLGSAPALKQLPITEATLHAPVRRPGKILIVGFNYPSHAKEVEEALAAVGKPMMHLPDEPNMKIISGSAVIGTGADIRLPRVAPERVDYEAEVAVVIGLDGADIDEADAWKHVAGLTIANDVSARDIQLRAMTGDAAASVGISKSFDTFKPMGPCLVTADEFGEPLDLRIQTRVNGELRQDDRTGTCVYSVPQLIAFMSRYQTLQSGDIILTGTPAGGGQFSQRYLGPGDVVEIEVESIGTLTNSVTA